MTGELLKHCRQVAGYTQAGLAEAVGVSQSTMVRLENDAFQMRPATQRKIMEAFASEGIGTKEISLLTELFKSKGMR
ncbi:helix-turn-helix transcriptional regulator [Alteribacter lacisalsi]|nr:helix-turn-helix transcriptional regulator [Alteribacter lacisalsi]